MIAPTTDRRAWWRLHRSTCLGTCLLAISATIVFLPGWQSHEYNRLIPNTQRLNALQSARGLTAASEPICWLHGWPWVALERWQIEEPSDLYENAQWRSWQAWKITGFSSQWHLQALFGNALVALAATIFVAAFLEVRRRRLRSLLQFTFFDLLIATAVAALAVNQWRTTVQSGERLQTMIESHFSARSDPLPPSLLDRLAYDPLRKFYCLQHVVVRDFHPEAISDLSRLARTEKLVFAGRNRAFQDEHLAVLAKLSRLESLSLDSTSATGVGFRHFVHCPQLRSISLIGSPTASQGIDEIVLLESLEELLLDSAKASDQHLAKIGQLTKLRRLDLSRTYASEQTFAAISTLPALTNLSADGVLLSDSCLEHIGKIRTLEELNLCNSQGVTAAGLRHLAQLPNLKRLELFAAKITDTEVEVFNEFPALKFVDLRWNAITDQSSDLLMRLASKYTIRLELNELSKPQLAAIEQIGKIAAARPSAPNAQFPSANLDADLPFPEATSEPTEQ